jgi:flagellar basal-body rod protein FlgB
MSELSTPMLDKLERYLDLTAYRQGLVASNLANIDTPGYRTKDIRFEDELSNATEFGPTPQEVPGLIERPDGNNVSVDRESILLAQTQLQFRVATELLRMQFHRLSTAITEGKS